MGWKHSKAKLAGGHSQGRAPGAAKDGRPNPEKCGRPTRAGSKKQGTPPDGHPCQLPAGFGTPNRNGPCKHHGGLQPAQVVHHGRVDREKEATRELKRLGLFGQVDEVSASEVLRGELGRAAAMVRGLEARLARLEERGDTESLTFKSLQERWTAERGQLAKVAEACLRARVDEAQVELAQEHGELLARVLEGVLGDLELTPLQRAAARPLVQWHLLSTAGEEAGARPPRPSELPAEVRRQHDPGEAAREFQAAQSGSRPPRRPSEVGHDVAPVGRDPDPAPERPEGPAGTAGESGPELARLRLLTHERFRTTGRS